MSCNRECSNLCPNLIISTSVSIVTVGGTDTLLINIPLRTFNNKEKFCLIVAQDIPATATRYMPVALTIGGVTTTVYPLVRCNCAPVTQDAIETHKRYPMRININGSTANVRVLSGLRCPLNNNVQSIPIPTTPTTPTGGNA